MPLYHELIRHSGNQDLFRAIELSLAALSDGHAFHLHAEGLRGTGKTTIMRSAKRILPPIIRIKDCLYNCHPEKPHCPEHRQLTKEQLRSLDSETIPCPFLEISQAAKIGTVVGTIDLAKLTNRHCPEASLLPGTLVQAHRGIVFIDEINRLADTSPELADVLLDVMGTKPGRIQIEETGLPPVELPLSVTIWAASNPDEAPGSLSQVRRQLSDRFDLAVSMGRPNDYRAVHSILAGKTSPPASLLPTKEIVVTVAASMDSVVVSKDIRDIVASIYVDFNLESLRAVQALETASILAAVRSGKKAVSVEEVLAVAPLTLAHRTDHATMTSILKYLLSINAAPIIREELNITGQPVISKPFQEKQESTPASSWLRNVWRTIKDRLSLSPNLLNNPLNNPPLSQPPGQSTGRSQKEGRKPQTSDPMQAIIQSPPSLAVPLNDLPLDKFVVSEDEKRV